MSRLQLWQRAWAPRLCLSVLLRPLADWLTRPPALGRQFTLQCPPVLTLIPPGDSLTDAPRVTSNQLPGHRMAQTCGLVILTRTGGLVTSKRSLASALVGLSGVRVRTRARAKISLVCSCVGLVPCVEGCGRVPGPPGPWEGAEATGTPQLAPLGDSSGRSLAQPHTRGSSLRPSGSDDALVPQPEREQMCLFQFSSVAQSCLTLCDPKDCSTPGLPVHHHLPEFTQTHIMRIESVMPSNHLILCRPLLLLPLIPPSIRVFSNESALLIRWPKYWSFSFSISPSSEHPGLISLRMDWLDLLAVQGMLKSLLQHHSPKA